MAAQHDLVGDAPKALLPNCDALTPGAQRCLSVLDKPRVKKHIEPIYYNAFPLSLSLNRHHQQALHIGVLSGSAPNTRAPPPPHEAIGLVFTGQIQLNPNSTLKHIHSFGMRRIIAGIHRGVHNSASLGAILFRREANRCWQSLAMFVVCTLNKPYKYSVTIDFHCRCHDVLQICIRNWMTRQCLRLMPPRPLSLIPCLPIGIR